MQMLPIASYEFRYISRSLQTLVIFSIFFGVTFQASFLGINLFGNAGGNVYINAPYQIMQTLITLSIFAIFVSPAFVANGILRDTDNKFDGILYSTPISKKDYLAGRFLGSFVAMMVAFVGAPIGMLLGTILSTAEPELFGPTNIGQYLIVYFVYILPSMLTLAAIIFAVAVVSRNIMYSYLAAMGLWIIYAVSAEIDLIPPILDPFMFQVFEAETEYWTAVERNTNLLSFDGVLLINRFIWFGLATAIYAFAFKRFSFRTPTKQPMTKNGRKLDEAKRKTAAKSGYRGTPVWSRSALYRQFTMRTKFEVMSVLTSLPFIILMGLSGVLLLFNLLEHEVVYGVNAYPVTRLMIETMSAMLSGTLVGVLFFYSADVIWRERHHKFNEIIDAMPTPNWVFVTSKIVALVFVIISVVLLGIAAAISIQMLNGYYNFEVALYLERGLIYYGMPFIFLAILASFLQVVAKNHFLGMMLFGLYMAYILALIKFDFEHPLLSFGLGGIAAPLSDMNGSGRFMVAGYWMRAYWAAIAGLLLMLTYLLWNRGTFQPLAYRLRALRAFKSTAFAVPAYILLVAIIGTASFIFYNTNVLNRYVTSDDQKELQAAYERRYWQHADLPMPRTIDVKADVDIYPYKQRVETRMVHVLKNKTNQEILTVHVLFPPEVNVPMIELEAATLTSVDDSFVRYYIFDLNTPMRPGETRTLNFETLIASRGFPHKGADTSLVRNGTFITNDQIAPYIGFDPGYMISGRNERREYGLSPLPRKAKLEDASQQRNNADRQDSDFITFETTVSTVASQTAVAPGHLEKDWTVGGRHYFAYKMDVPIRNMYSYLSAEYEIVRDKWNDVDVEVFHHAPHTYNIERMIEGVKDSLDYYSKAFGPYQFQQARIIEIPAYQTLARAYPGNIPYSEGFGFVADVKENDIDVPYYVTAHEMAHQWWAHQVLPANVQGASMLAETFAQYSALLVMEKKYGEDRMRRFLKYELDSYLSGRANDPEGELPLNKVETQRYVFYRKGAVIMYALKDYLGEDVVNRSLQRLIALRAFNTDPYAITTDFLDILKAEAGPDYSGLIEDFFEKITLFDFKFVNSNVTALTDGRFKVVLNVEAHKFYADATGNEKEVPFDIPVEIGLFSRSPAADNFTGDDVLVLEKRRITSTKSTIEIIVEKEPIFAGIDPYNKLIDRNSGDNLGAVADDG